MKKPVFMAGVEIRQADNILVRIEADNGVVGWGEAASAPTMTGETVESMMAAVAYLAAAVEGRPAEDIAGTVAAMATRMYANNAAKAAIEMALHDLVGRATGQPAYALLGGKQRSRMAILGVISTGELASDLREAERKKADGYSAFKIKVGIDKPLVDAERTRRVCAILGHERVDLVRRQPGLERRRSDAVRARGRRCRARFLRAARARRRHRRHGGGDGGIRYDRDRRRRKHSFARGHPPPPRARRRARREPEDHQARRPARVMEAGRLCDRLGLNVNVSAKTGESSIACAAATHIAAALPQIAWGLTLSNEGLTDDATARPIRIEHGHVEVSDRPGLGIDVDEDRVRRYRRDVPVRQVA